MEFSNDVEKYEIEVTKMSQNNPQFSTVYRPHMFIELLEWVNKQASHYGLQST